MVIEPVALARERGMLKDECGMRKVGLLSIQHSPFSIPAAPTRDSHATSDRPAAKEAPLRRAAATL
jgi:hypothetical protein